MENQTRQLLRTLADELTDELLSVLASGAALETELQRRTASSRQTLARRLGDLEALGLVISERRATPGRGRPTRSWALASRHVVEFLHEADEFLLQLLENQASRHRDAIRPAVSKGNVRELRP